MFLLYKNPDTPPRVDPELAPVGRFFLRIRKEMNTWQQLLKITNYQSGARREGQRKRSVGVTF
jgi:DNA-binding HxlR family transcriptional regulator